MLPDNQIVYVKSHSPTPTSIIDMSTIVRCKSLFDNTEMSTAEIYDYLQSLIPGILAVNPEVEARFCTGILHNVMSVYDCIDPEIPCYVKKVLVARHLAELAAAEDKVRKEKKTQGWMYDDECKENGNKYNDRESDGYESDGYEREGEEGDEFEASIVSHIYVLAKLQYIAVKLYGQLYGSDMQLLCRADWETRHSLSLISSNYTRSPSFAHRALCLQADNLKIDWETMVNDDRRKK